MKVINTVTIFAISLLMYSCIDEKNYGYAEVDETLNYEKILNYFPHDKLIELEMGGILDSALLVKSIGENIQITNSYGDGFGGHGMSITLTPNLKIIQSEFYKWIDTYDDTKTLYEVESISLTLNNNPFKEKFISGKYIAQIKEDFISTDHYRNNGYGDTTRYYEFYGKFKEYTDEELRLKSK